MSHANEFRDAVKDPDAEHPVASAWRPVLREIVKAFVRGDYALTEPIPSVAPVSAQQADQMKRYVADYGETLRDIPDETWRTSAYRWMGSWWDVLVDLWTIESGPSDLVLFVRVFEMENGFRFEVLSLHVP